MRRIFALFFLLVATALSPASAQTGLTAQALVGTWTASAQHPSGGTIAANVALKADKQFVGTVTTDGKLVWEYAGTWSLSGRELKWVYEKSSRAQPAPGFTDIDEVVSVNATTLVLSSRLSGRATTYTRAQ